MQGVTPANSGAQLDVSKNGENMLNIKATDTDLADLTAKGKTIDDFNKQLDDVIMHILKPMFDQIQHSGNKISGG